MENKKIRKMKIKQIIYSYRTGKKRWIMGRLSVTNMETKSLFKPLYIWIPKEHTVELPKSKWILKANTWNTVWGFRLPRFKIMTQLMSVEWEDPGVCYLGDHTEEGAPRNNAIWEERRNNQQY